MWIYFNNKTRVLYLYIVYQSLVSTEFYIFKLQQTPLQNTIYNAYYDHFSGGGEVNPVINTVQNTVYNANNACVVVMIEA